jgi:hypothetical protein
VLDLLVHRQRREEAGERRLELRLRVVLSPRREEERGAVCVALESAEQARPVMDEPQPGAIRGEMVRPRGRDEPGEIGVASLAGSARGERRSQRDPDQGLRREAT